MWVMDEIAEKYCWANVATLPFKRENDSDGPHLCFVKQPIYPSFDFLYCLVFTS